MKWSIDVTGLNNKMFVISLIKSFALFFSFNLVKGELKVEFGVIPLLGVIPEIKQNCVIG